MLGLCIARAKPARRVRVSQDIGAGNQLHAVAAVKKLRPEELARPAALRPLLTLLSCGDGIIERLALQLLSALVDSSAEAATLIRWTLARAGPFPESPSQP